MVETLFCLTKCVFRVLCGLWCSFTQTSDALSKRRKKKKKERKINIYSICFGSILILFIRSDFSCLFNFIFDSP